MIEAKELRVGNLVFGPLDKIMQIVLIDDTCEPCYLYAHCINDSNICEHGFKPIPITEEWLVKFGFEKQTAICGFKWHKGNFYILQVGKNSFYCDYCLVFAIDYIHQLQNLYFALTQKELE